eukprot:TRINITY_DN108486_c0_g1_i1.p1 TRINITY_DN108486_c0_g1~~TRINITY_DN108486_c0_g1_i1.p1  ORF type:complete len:280 (-),score=68.69 TRINITY_DN108486_c0_g1_i1:190-999(-)
MATLSGTVKTFNVHKGWGFVECNGQDHFLHKKELKGMCVDKGTQVQFVAEQSEKGVSAVNVTVHVSDPSQAWYFGEVKSFNPNKGFGFITSEAFDGKDIFVLKTDLQDGWASAGASCKMKVESQEKGLIAKEVQLLGTSSGGQWGQDQMQMMKGMMSQMMPWGMGGKGMGMGGMGQGIGMGGMGQGMGMGGHGKGMGMGGMGKGMGGSQWSKGNAGSTGGSQWNKGNGGSKGGSQWSKGGGGGTGVWQPMFMKQDKGKGKGQMKGKSAW